MTAVSRITVLLYGSPGASSAPNMAAFAQGLRRHGIIAQYGSYAETGDDCDLAVFWAHRKAAVIERQRSRCRRYLVMERGYIGDRMEWTSLGYDGLNGRADFCLDGVDDSRWRKYWTKNRTLKPWRARRTDAHVVLIGQVPNDAALAGADLTAWYREAAVALAAAHRLPVTFRPHPHPDGAGVCVVGTALAPGTLDDAFRSAYLVVTYNSNVGVLAAMAGIPTVAIDRGSMAWDVAGHDFAAVVRPDRSEWAHRLAWCQWTLQEMASGEAWDHLKQGMRAWL